MEARLMHLALVGTPNSGKTSLFNALTGSRQKVANYPGVTVERKEGFFVTPLGRQTSLVDLPGTYSLRGRSPDEEITRDFVLGRAAGETPPDLVLCVADSTNLRLTVRLLLELKQTGRPLMLVLNMFDIAARRGVIVDVPRMSEMLGVSFTITGVRAFSFTQPVICWQYSGTCPTAEPIPRSLMPWGQPKFSSRPSAPASSDRCTMSCQTSRLLSTISEAMTTCLG